MSVLRRVANWCARHSVALANARFEEALHRTTPPLLAQHRVPGLQASWVIARKSSNFSCMTRTFGHGADAKLRFRFGSISKPISAILAVALARDGVLDLDEPLERELEPFAFGAPREWLAKVTPRLLLSHTAGLKELNPPRKVQEPGAADWLDGALVQWEAAPATRTVYSGAGYALLERIIESRSKQAFHVAARRLLFEPLGVPGCCFERELQDEDCETVVRECDADGQPITAIPSLCSASSGLVAKTSDVCALVSRALLTDFFPPPLLHALLTPQPASLAGATFTAGLRVHSGSTFTDVRSLTHAGQRPRHRSVLVIVPSARAVACIATNAHLGAAILKPLTGLFRDINV
jgi:CubicO group peptidase (beta-lactamase class C family)